MQKLFLSIWKAIIGIIRAGSQTNIRLLLGSFVITLVLAYFLEVSRTEWLIIMGISGWVLSLELINTCIELLCDKITKSYDKEIGLIKDIAAGAVFLATLFALVIGLVIFIPKIITLIAL